MHKSGSADLLFAGMPMVYCSKCGERLPDDANFCTKCRSRTSLGLQSGVHGPGEEWREAFAKMGEEMEKAFQVAAKELHEALKTAAKNVRETKGQGPVACKNCGEKTSQTQHTVLVVGKSSNEQSGPRTPKVHSCGTPRRARLPMQEPKTGLGERIWEMFRQQLQYPSVLSTTLIRGWPFKNRSRFSQNKSVKRSR
jgi:hypothetical protein